MRHLDMRLVCWLAAAVILIPSLGIAKEEMVKSKIWSTTYSLQGIVDPERLIYQTIELRSGQSGFYWYRTDDGKWLSFLGNIEGINLFLKERISQDIAPEFVRTNLLELVAGSLLQNSKIIDSHFLAALDDKSRSVIDGLDWEVITDIQSGDWSIDTLIATPLGGVERWHLSGRFDSLQISKVIREVVLPPESFLMPVYV